eukprot:TRINITY_DN31995_c0_g1_i1.p1 TRINITY_DN31995_c0_g1~~TRINITY_DN31995_c0_g1_i1.p1  ORF type:complete len:311 (+),score=97.72 TRINITY_DN31995_c0_g1_i1:94-1026(+)
MIRLSSLLTRVGIRTGSKLKAPSTRSSIIPSVRTFSSEVAAEDAVAKPVKAPKYKEAKVGNLRQDGSTMRWYKAASVEPFKRANESGYLVLLDGRVIKTPKDNRLLLPTKELALAIAAEWEMQGKNILPAEMPLMTLAATALDQVPERRGVVVDSLMSHLKTDSVCIREEDERVAERQAALHDPLIKWFSSFFKLPPVQVTQLFAPASYPPETMHGLQWLLFQQDDWTLAGLDSLTHNTKSLILSLALWHGAISLEDGIKAARVEEDWSVDQYGEVPGGHDVDRVNNTVKISAATVFLHLLPPPPPPKLG